MDPLSLTFLPPQDADVLAYDDFLHLMAVSTDVHSTAPLAAMEISDERDKPALMAMLLVERHLRDARRFQSFMWRYWGVMALIIGHEIDDWVSFTSYQDHISIHPDVFDVARQAPLNEEGAFDSKSFRRELLTTKRNSYGSIILRHS